MNMVMLIGDLASDVEVRDVRGDHKVANFLLAVQRQGAEGKADFVRITAWNKQAEVCGRFLSKGRRVAVDGKLRTRSWDDAEGKRRSAVEVVANSIQFLSAPDAEASGADTPFEAAAA